MARRPRKAARLWWAILLLAMVGAVLWWYRAGGEWRPDETAWPNQGVHVTQGDQAVRFATLRGLGVRFVYLDASLGAERASARFANDVSSARAEGLAVGAVHWFDPCVVADGQSARFVTTVPRDADLLPPAILLDRTGDDCPERVTQAAIRSELTTLVNQIEAHAGKPVILSIGREFEERYAIAARMERDLWLHSDRREPDYAGRPWTIWTANEAYRSEASDGPLRWLVARS